MINFEPKYVHCFWKDELEGKKGIVSDTIGGIKDIVENITDDRYEKWFGEICKNPNNSRISYPFGFINDSGSGECFQFCYYDPNFEYKIAYEEGKEIQVWNKFRQEWEDCKCRPLWSDDFTEYRIKSDDEYEIVILCGLGLRIVQSTVSPELRRILFTGTEKECEQWVKDNYHLQIVIDGYFENEPIVYKEKGVKNDPWKETKELPYNWDFDHYEYRINRAEESKEDKYVPFENTQEIIEAWEKKCPANKDRPNGTMPLIWIKEKDNKNFISLITDFNGYGVSTSYKDMSFDSLFEKYTFADGSVCGKKK